jgi:hypothetical protein
VCRHYFTKVAVQILRSDATDYLSGAASQSLILRRGLFGFHRQALAAGTAVGSVDFNSYKTSFAIDEPN